VWLKDRASAGTNSHQLFDSVRGGGKRLSSNTTDAEATNPSNGYLSTFDADGFSSVAGATDNFNWNNSGTQYAAWNWKKGATQGFDIVTYTGTGANRTVAHSLGVAPKMMIVKRRDGGVDYWDVLHQSANNGSGHLGALFLQRTDAWTSSSAEWNNTAPTSSVFSVGTSSSSNANGGTYVAYLFAEVAGFSKFGSYTGNGSADGPFVYLGFRPRFVLIKNTAIGSNWAIWDTSRSAYNQVQDYLLPNLSAAEGNASTVSIDVTANGFKVRGTDSGINGSGNTIIFAAFAENPFKNSLAR
jgi:hypothetical protein